MDGQQMTKKRNPLILVVLALLVVAGLGAGIWRAVDAGAIDAGAIYAGSLPLLQGLTPKSTATSSAYQATAVRQGDILLTISGSGQVITLTSRDLSFPTSGTIAALNVTVGQTVSKGEVLATLGGVDDLKLQISQQKVALAAAQKALDDLQANSGTALAQAQYNLAAAQKALATTQANLHLKGDARCVSSKTEAYYQSYVQIKSFVDTWEGYLKGGTGYSQTYILQRLNPARIEEEKAYANWQYCQGYTDQEIQDAQIAYQLAQANLEKANATYTNMKANSGVDPLTLKIDQAAVKNAQSQLAMLQEELDGATIVSPIDGYVTVVNSAVGQAITPEDGAVIKVEDMLNPQVQVNIDETDMENFAAGCPVVVTFDSLTGQTFPGVVTQVEPSLVSVQSVSMVQGLVALERKQTASGKTLPLGLSGTVEVTCQQVKGVLIIPAQGLYEQNASTYVYVLNAQDQPEKRTVEVGLKTVALAEIKSGLKVGEKVITSTVETGK